MPVDIEEVAESKLGTEHDEIKIDSEPFESRVNDLRSYESINERDEADTDRMRERSPADYLVAHDNQAFTAEEIARDVMAQGGTDYSVWVRIGYNEVNDDEIGTSEIRNAVSKEVKKNDHPGDFVSEELEEQGRSELEAAMHEYAVKGRAQQIELVMEENDKVVGYETEDGETVYQTKSNLKEALGRE